MPSCGALLVYLLHENKRHLNIKCADIYAHSTSEVDFWLYSHPLSELPHAGVLAKSSLLMRSTYKTESALRKDPARRRVEKRT